jgi:transcriptional pleiotropic regulator of transition state genes
MKAIGIVRNVDALGRIVIPKEMREKFDMEVGNPVEIFADDDSVVLKSYKPACFFCGEPDESLLEYQGKKICRKCLKTIQSLSTK